MVVFCRNIYEYMVMNHQEKGRSRTGKRENFSMQQLQDAREQYDEEATLFVFRLKSLKQGQSRSLLTQAARHHAAQVSSAFVCVCTNSVQVNADWFHFFLSILAALIQKCPEVT